jgi:hypothetical protein
VNLIEEAYRDFSENVGLDGLVSLSFQTHAELLVEIKTKAATQIHSCPRNGISVEARKHERLGYAGDCNDSGKVRWGKTEHAHAGCCVRHYATFLDGKSKVNTAVDVVERCGVREVDSCPRWKGKTWSSRGKKGSANFWEVRELTVYHYVTGYGMREVATTHYSEAVRITGQTYESGYFCSPLSDGWSILPHHYATEHQW